jgi:hypothetical protein
MQARMDAMATLRDAHKDARTKAAEEAKRAIMNAPDVLVARVALQLFQQQLAPLKRAKSPPIGKVDLTTATPEQLGQAEVTVIPFTTRIMELRQMVAAAADKPARQAAQQVAKQARVDAVGELQAARKLARENFDAAAGDEIGQVVHREALIAARLALQQFQQFQQAMAHAPRPNRYDPSTDPAGGPPPKPSPPPEVVGLATAAVDILDVELQPLRDAVTAADNVASKKEAKKVLKTAIGTAMAKIQRDRAEAKAAVDAAADKQIKRALQPALQLARVTVQTFKHRMQSHQQSP